MNLPQLSEADKTHFHFTLSEVSDELNGLMGQKTFKIGEGYGNTYEIDASYYKNDETETERWVYNLVVNGDTLFGAKAEIIKEFRSTDLHEKQLKLRKINSDQTLEPEKPEAQSVLYEQKLKDEIDRVVTEIFYEMSEDNLNEYEN